MIGFGKSKLPGQRHIAAYSFPANEFIRPRPGAKVLTVGEVAEYLRVHGSTLYRL
jgi:hypothetical protein